ncbi:DUF6123 family protein [Neobacillus sp. D3-1R]|uniref:DUF6123 family protein n=1 Tax=Neobacillus sp. D3-1R TaxID=3445778 RepID=UPI003F9F11F6
MDRLEQFIATLKSKGFQLQEDAIGFIYFGKHFTNAPDDVIIAAIELTLKAQKSFDGSFYISLLETFTVQKVLTRDAALQFFKDREILI